MSTGNVDVGSAKTTGGISAMLGKPVHQVEYAISSRGIQPVGLAARIRLFGPSEIEQVKVALAEMDEERARRRARVQARLVSASATA